MDCDYIRNKASEAAIECHVKYFPVNCFEILKHYGYRIYTYSDLQTRNPELYDMCISYSEDAFRSGSMHIVAYNDKKPMTRIRFSLMHELGHHLLEHKNDSSENEAEANYFASNLLAPRIAMYYAKLKTIIEVADLFDLSSSAAYYAAQDFSEWCNEIQRRGMHGYDKDLYKNFYNQNYGGFVYSVKKCECCGAEVYNSKKPYCRGVCELPEEPLQRRFFTPFSEDEVRALRRFENNWHYKFGI